jgi:hypothetical protein
MGWTGTSYYRGKSLFEFFSERFNGEHGKLLDLALVNRTTAYGAWQNTRPDGTKYVIGMVILIRWSPGEIYYKEMSEDMGPNEDSCPERILKQLSPLEDFLEPGNCMDWAKSWRESAWRQVETAKRWCKVKVGDIIHTNRFTFSDGVSRSTFLVQNKSPLSVQSVYADTNGDPRLGSYVRLRASSIKRKFEVVGKASGEQLIIF